MQLYNTTGALRGGDLFGQQQVAMPVEVVVTGAQWLDTDGDGDDDDDGHCSTERLLFSDEDTKARGGGRVFSGG